MKVIQRIIEIVKAIIYLPVNIIRFNDSMSRIEWKLDLITQHFYELESNKTTKDNFETVEPQTLLRDITFSIEEHLKNELSFLTSIINQKFENQYLQFESLLSLYNSLPNLNLLPATRGWAGSPDFLAKISEVILKERPDFVLEAGSGVSTIIIGLALKLNNNGKSISLDHDRIYATATNENIQINGISQIVNVKHCPLKDYTSFDQTWKWYNIENLNLVKKIDMLVIDGPPGATQYLARYPAVFLLHEHFSDRTIILLDDSSRNDESIIVQKWLNFLESNNFKTVVTQYNNFEKGLTILEVFR